MDYEEAKAEFASLYEQYQRTIFELKPQYLAERRRAFYDKEPTQDEIDEFEAFLAGALARFNALCQKMVDNEFVACHFPDSDRNEVAFEVTKAQALSWLRQGKTLFPYV